MPTLSILLPLLLLLAASWLAPAEAMRPDRVAELRRETVKMFYHGFDNYMNIAFPEDELRPVSCSPLTRDNLNPRNVELNDVLGNYSLTLIDSLSTLAILASAPSEDGDVGPKALRDFQDGVAALVQQYGDGRPGPSGLGQRGRGFDQDSKVQVFETVIRGVGGLLSAHLFAVGELPITGYAPPRPPPPPLSPDQLDEQPPIVWPNGFRYDGQLLRLALDLATRLLPAFYTPTGMPYPRVNLRYGIPFYANSPLHGAGSGDGSSNGGNGNGNGNGQGPSGPAEITETCSAGAGSLVLEFTVLSRLTGDPRFEQLAKRAFWAVWYRRSDIGLIGAGVDAEQGRWIGAYSVIGAGADSFFEYALKTYILLSGHKLPNQTYAQPPASPPRRAHRSAEAAAAPATTTTTTTWHDPNVLFPRLSDQENAPDSFLEAWHQAHAAIKRHLYSDREHPHYVNVNIWTGSLAAQWIDSLGAYYSGLLTLAGELEEAIETNLLYTAVWTKYAALPERWSLKERTVEGGLGWWPLRPEFVESVYHIYRATKDPWYLYVGEMVQRDIQRRCWTPCGWAGLQNVVSGEMTDRMESFFLGETAKYLYLLFDDRHPLNALDAAYVFTTEGHPLILPKRRQGEDGKTTKPKTPRAETMRHAFETERHRAAEATAEVEEEEQGHGTGDDLALYADDDFTNTCPTPPARAPLTGSGITVRRDLYHAAKMLDLHTLPPDADRDGQPNTPPGSNHSFFPWTLPPNMLPDNGTSAKVQEPLEMSLEFSSPPPVPPPPQQQAAAVPNGGLGGARAGGRGRGSSDVFGNVNHVMVGASTLARVAPDKIRVLSLSGLKLVFRLDDEDNERTWRITRVNGVHLGRDESVVLDRALLSHISDPRFILVRDPVVVKLHHLHHVVWMAQDGQHNGTDVPIMVVVDDDDDEDGDDVVEETAAEQDDSDGDRHSQNDEPHPDGEATPPNAQSFASFQQTSAPSTTSASSGLATLVKSFWRRIVSSLDGGAPDATAAPRGVVVGGSATAGSSSSSSSSRNGRRRSERRQTLNVVLNATGVTPTGLGAAPLPAVDIPAGAAFPAAGAVPHALLPWTTVYAGGYACDGALPATAVRDHQVLVVRRGRCSFSDKLANVPVVAPGPQRLQLVVVVSDDDDVHVGGGFGGSGGSSSGSGSGMTFHDDANTLVRPLLDATQRTPAGLPRWQPLAMIMVGGGAEAYEQITAARQLGLTRRYRVESQGVRIRNAIIDDGDTV
ncbi:er glycosyl hydrolase [Niveomyces insectorum RCEF 264]|uniref:alpha-1,2-Mannosidase n=1 Tax=Niveomyces insectorum RCEF 264 TaxID=1081102 RepID=A0A167VL03_9HYPO|nr:er glycosyl hydrolase [Niveomyces insectorum RCEF 264]